MKTLILLSIPAAVFIGTCLWMIIQKPRKIYIDDNAAELDRLLDYRD